MYCKVLPSKVAIRLPNNNSGSRARAAAGSPAEFRVVEATKGREDKPIERYRERGDRERSRYIKRDTGTRIAIKIEIWRVIERERERQSESERHNSVRGNRQTYSQRDTYIR